MSGVDAFPYDTYDAITDKRDLDSIKQMLLQEKQCTPQLERRLSDPAGSFSYH